MKDAVLVAVHPGYVRTYGLAIPRFGDYEGYLSRLYNELTRRKSIVFAYKNTKIPFRVPNDVKIIRDHNRGCYVKELIKELKAMGAGRVQVGGESLWFNGGNINENLERFAEKLPPDKKTQFENALQKMHVISPSSLAKRVGLDSKQIAEDIFYTGNEICDGCVCHVFRELDDYFAPSIVRELCYPTTDP